MSTVCLPDEDSELRMSNNQECRMDTSISLSGAIRQVGRAVSSDLLSEVPGGRLEKLGRETLNFGEYMKMIESYIS